MPTLELGRGVRCGRRRARCTPLRDAAADVVLLPVHAAGQHRARSSSLTVGRGDRARASGADSPRRCSWWLSSREDRRSARITKSRGAPETATGVRRADPSAGRLLVPLGPLAGRGCCSTACSRSCWCARCSSRGARIAVIAAAAVLIVLDRAVARLPRRPLAERRARGVAARRGVACAVRVGVRALGPSGATADDQLERALQRHA